MEEDRRKKEMACPTETDVGFRWWREQGEETGPAVPL